MIEPLSSYIMDQLVSASQLPTWTNIAYHKYYADGNTNGKRIPNGIWWKSVAPFGAKQIREAPPKKKRENVGILKKQGGGGLPESHFHVLLFLTWENPQKRS